MANRCKRFFRIPSEQSSARLAARQTRSAKAANSRRRSTVFALAAAGSQRLRMSGEVSGFCLLAMAEQAAQASLVPFEAKTERGSLARTASLARVAYADTALSQARERLRYLLVKGAGPRLQG